MNEKRFPILFIIVTLLTGIVYGQVNEPETNAIYYQTEITANVGLGKFAPYYIASNQHGTTTQAESVGLRLQIHRHMNTKKRFSWSAGADIIANLSSETEYMRYSEASASWTINRQRPSAFRIQQLYGQLKWRSAFLTIGLQQHHSALLNQQLTSGDLVESGNARPIPEIRAGLLSFRNIPFTNGWIQIQGEFAYGKPTDNGWLRDHYNYYNSFLTTGWLYHYKRVYFRTKPERNLSVTVGMQAAAQFSGTQHYYHNGTLAWTKHQPFKLIDLLDMFITRTDDSYYKGNHLGSWDMRARYRLPKGDNVYFYFQWPWEDGSGIGKLNGWDGTWGLEWKKSTPAPVSGIVAEVLYFMNQSGSVHYDPEDLPGTTLPEHTDGADDYYNNYYYNGYAYYGMGIGSPIFPSPIYNIDGYMRYTDTRLRGFHIGISGEFTLPGHNLHYRMLGGYREVFGSGYVPRRTPAHDTSWMIEATWLIKKLPALSVNAQLAMDRGTIYGNQTGFRLGIVYTGALTLKPNK